LNIISGQNEPVETAAKSYSFAQRFMEPGLENLFMKIMNAM